VTSGDEQVSDSVLAEKLADTVKRITDSKAAQQDAQDEQNELIREAMRRNWSQSRIAKALGVSQQAISKRKLNPPQGGTTE
jgi:transcriptional regulator with PAS, ATPase and Fis domain